ncbi:PAPA-1-like conserved region-domain-containing protein [Aspergillus crustosus]
MPSDKLREATSGSSRSAAARRSHNVFTDNPIVSGPRASRSQKRLVEVDTSEEEEDLDDQEEDEVDEDDAPGEDDDEDDEDADADADADADGDVDMDDAPPQPPVSKRHAKAAVAAQPNRKPTKSVEAKEMELEEEEDEDEDEEELSEPETDADGEPDDQEEGLTINADEVEELDEEEEDDDLDESDDGTPTAGDISKLTKRQRGSLGNDFLQLPMEPQIKKHLTAEERAMRRAEMARRRKNLSEKRNEEEKGCPLQPSIMDTINRLLRKQAPKRRGRIPAAEAAENAAADQELAVEYEPVDPIMVRWVSGRQGSIVGVPEEWVGTPAGRIFGGTPRKLVEEL